MRCSIRDWSALDAYAELVTTQQLLASELGWTVPRPFAASTAALALVTSIAPVHVVRLLLPLIGFATVMALIVAIHRWTRNLGAALVAAVLLSLLAPAYSRSPSNEFADLFLLLSLLFWHATLTGERQYKWAAAAVYGRGRSRRASGSARDVCRGGRHPAVAAS